MDNAGTMRVKDIIAYLNSFSQRSYRDEGLHYGNPNQEVKKAMVCWLANCDAIEYAGKMGVDLIISHESMFLPYDILNIGGVPDFLSWRSNRRKIEMLAKYSISVVRCHETLDELCIFEELAAFLGLPAAVIDEPWLVKLYDIEEMEYGALVDKVKSLFKLEHTRYTDGDPKRKVKRIGLPCGGLGLKGNIAYMQKLIDHGCDVLIAGESENYSFNFMRDAGIDLIETSHELTENPGLKKFCQRMADDLKNIEVIFFENKPPFVCR